ncbi:MAG: hypothetical protein A3G24_10515 [Betaproteobacteria bacterium RIFCSPLOWO2_12_FULL_62_13]|nr:MAG: hypothetical protein A3G24_10515 [Betaproteobacteria bacterium RIFCSPLOWO2_12_FULL_62_13]
MVKYSLVRTGHTLRTVAAVFIGLALSGVFTTLPAGAASTAGEAVPNVTLSTSNGDFRLSQQKGRVLILFFTFPG